MSVMGLFQGEGSLVKREKRRDGKRGERERERDTHTHTHIYACIHIMSDGTRI